MPRTIPRYTACVFCPAVLLSVTVEAGEEGFDEMHFHPGGQGFWIARTLRSLGERPVVVTTLGGESGRVLRGLAPAWDVELCAVEIDEASPVQVHDRRSGERREIARTRPPGRDRHESDDLYGRVLEHATSTGTCVVTGRVPGDSLPLAFYARLGADLAAVGADALVDLHGEELAAFLEGGAVHTLKVSDDDLREDGVLGDGATHRDRCAAVDRFARQGARRVVLSSARHATLARFGDRTFRAVPPVLEAADHRGSGDAMTAALVAAALRRLDPPRVLQLACAAGAASATRRGLGSADAELVESLADRVAVEELETTR